MKRAGVISMSMAIAMAATLLAGCETKTGNPDDRKPVATEAYKDTEDETEPKESEIGGADAKTADTQAIDSEVTEIADIKTIDTVTIDTELLELEKKAEEMNDRLTNGTLAQQEMNRLSGELYRLWDDELNLLWSRLKETLDVDEMEQLTEEEREWIAKKDEEVKAAGKEAEGGSLQPLLENDTAAVLTRERVYELAELLKAHL